MAAIKSMSKMRQFLILFAQEHIEFRISELKSIVSLLKVDADFSSHQHGDQSPFLLVDLPSEECARKIMGRSILAKSSIEVWAQGTTYPEVCQQLKLYPQSEMEPYCHEDVTFCFKVHTFGKQLNSAAKLEAMKSLEDYLPLKGKVRLRDPDQIFYIFEDYGTRPNQAPEKPYRIFVGRWIADGQKRLAHTYSVKKRHFIGNTSMDALLSFLMANQAAIKQNSFVFDPFVGTGSLLVAVAHFGGFVAGCDINYNVIHGKGKASRAQSESKYRGRDENIRANLKQYGLDHKYIDVLISDFSRNIWREQPLFDAIITDPPYGIREKTRKVGSDKEPYVRDDQTSFHMPVTQSYFLSDIFTDLLNFSAHFLRLNGRLVYWLPVYRPEYSEDQIPQHPCLQMVANDEQILNSSISRRLITMEKKQHVIESTFSQATICKDKYAAHNAIRDKFLIQNTLRTKDSPSTSESKHEGEPLSKESLANESRHQREPLCKESIASESGHEGESLSKESKASEVRHEREPLCKESIASESRHEGEPLAKESALQPR
ncbi:tRNA (guanine(10)-N(2))-methyltransferase homolog [Diadema setosum]|uniref:tRNA (guanine(10)-N(2))-methyltransferase homolog n=1 Tax=Diadema setosum TaxID=31175 RepID=UPI003B3AEC3D